MGYFIPLRETDSPRRTRWGYRAIRLSLVIFFIALIGSLTGLLPDDTWLFGVAIVLCASGLCAVWETGY